MKQESSTVSCEHELGLNGQTILLTIEKFNKKSKINLQITKIRHIFATTNQKFICL